MADAAKMLGEDEADEDMQGAHDALSGYEDSRVHNTE